jgi:predicted RNA binding protein YcfA (HicA-like mRNA interferase family)
VSYKEQIKLATAAGYTFHRMGRGSHELWRNETTGQIILIARSKLALRAFKRDLKRKADSA